MNLRTDTHYYDGKIGEIYRNYVSMSDNKDDILLPFDKCIEKMIQWSNDTKIMKPLRNVKKGIDLLNRDYKKSGNYDDRNKISVEELLPKVIKIVENFDNSGKSLFLTTIGEIVELGSCSQGRISRLLGFYIPFVEISKNCINPL